MGSMKEPWLVKMWQWSILDLACWYRLWFVFNCMICTCVATCTVHVWQYDHFDICVMFGGYEANHVNLDDRFCFYIHLNDVPPRRVPHGSHIYRPVTCLWKPHLSSWSSCGVWIYARCHWIYNAIQCSAAKITPEVQILTYNCICVSRWSCNDWVCLTTRRPVTGSFLGILTQLMHTSKLYCTHRCIHTNNV